MDNEILIITALSIGFVHTVIGPDHYLPFVVMAKAKNWSMYKTMWITLVAGIGHVFGSVVLGALGIALGIAVNLLEGVESVRGDIAAWLLIAFGFAYGVWGLRVAWRSKEHTHTHEHGEEDIHGDGHHSHSHTHNHLGGHIHLHGNEKSITPWVLFTVFVLGPCEPLIPILMYPAAKGSWLDVVWVSLAFGAVTIGTMMTVVYLAVKGLANLRTEFLEKYIHALAGFIIAVSGLSIQFLGL
jgi:sulfite exporter TauE/SafE